MPKGPKLPVQVIAQQWLFTYRYPTYGGVETTQLYLPVNKIDRTPRHLARRDPLLLGLQARRQGRREPGRRQRRLRQADEASELRTCAARSCAASGTATCTTHGRVVTPAGLQRLDQRTAEAVRASDEGAAPVQQDLPTRTDEAWRMSTTSEAASAATSADAAAAVAPAARLQPADGGDPRRRRLLPRLVDRPSDQRPRAASNTRRDRRERRRAAARLLLRRGRLPDRARLRQLPGLAPARPAGVAAREGERGDRALLRPVHRPQGRRDAVPGRDRRVLLRRRAQRDADPRRAAAPGAHVRRPQPVPVAGGDARHDDDGNDDLGHPRPVRQLLRADHDRRQADGLPADRVADVLAADGRRLHPRLDDLLRRLPDRLDGLCAAQRPGRDGHGLLHLLLRAGRDLDGAAGAEHDGHDHHHARARPDVVAPADLRVVGVRDRDPDGARRADADRHAA